VPVLVAGATAPGAFVTAGCGGCTGPASDEAGAIAVCIVGLFAGLFAGMFVE